MKRKGLPGSSENIDSVIQTVRGQKIILDTDLARIYGVPTKRLNEQIKRNRDRFPEDFMFQLTWDEWRSLKPQPIESATVEGNRSQFATGSSKHRDPRMPPFAFTEHGAIMAANVLNSPQAVQMSVFVVRAFLKMRASFADTRELARTLAALEAELKGRLDVHEWWPTARSHCGRAPTNHATARSDAGTGAAATTNRIPRPAGAKGHQPRNREERLSC